MRVLVVNAGSSSLKLSVVDDGGGPEPSHLVEHWDRSDASDIARFVEESAGRVDAVGHRVVHGGSSLREPVVVDQRVEEAILALSSLAPLHQPAAVAGMRTVRQVLRDRPHVACFDTAFHASLPAVASTYALPEEWRGRWDLRRFGFHGLSHGYAGRRGAELVRRSIEGLRAVTCHLGAGASLCAQLDGRSVDTTMGLTPLEGLVMATRSGTVDPGLVLWLQRYGGLGVDEVNEGLEQRSGLAGLSGTSGDFREVMEGMRRRDARSELAFGVYVHRLRGLIGAMTAAVGGLDLLVFTGGVGEHSPELRATVVDGLGYLGVALDADANEAARADAVIGAVVSDPDRPGASAAVAVVTAREDLEIALQVRKLLGGEARSTPATPGRPIS
jgi:acetate kinase